MTEKPRTLSQNASLHLWYAELADALNAAGLDVRVTLKPSVEIPWTPELIKDLMWRPVQKAALGKESTTELTTAEVSKVYDILNRHLGERFGLHVAFPNIDELLSTQEPL